MLELALALQDDRRRRAAARIEAQAEEKRQAARAEELRQVTEATEMKQVASPGRRGRRLAKGARNGT